MILLDDADKDGLTNIVSWLSNGKGFAIHNKKKFVESVLPKYFTKNEVQFTSFTRKLRRWGFRSNRMGHNKISYSHQMFLRGDEVSCQKMSPLNNERDVPSSRFPLRRRRIRGVVPVGELEDHQRNPSTSATTLSQQPRNQQILRDEFVMVPSTSVSLVGCNPPTEPQMMMPSMMARQEQEQGGVIPSNTLINQAYIMTRCNAPAALRIDSSSELTNQLLQEGNLCAGTNDIIGIRSITLIPASDSPPGSFLNVVEPLLEFQSSPSPYQELMRPFQYLVREQRQWQQQDNRSHEEKPSYWCTNEIGQDNLCTNNAATGEFITATKIMTTSDRSLSNPSVVYLVTPLYCLSRQEPSFLPFDINQG
jgi:Heat shock transcription factor